MNTNKKKSIFANSNLEGGIKTKNAFTLIELLAIIVILAIIAVITVPIILNVIDESKKGAVKDSAYGYKNAIESYYATEIMNEPDLKFEGEYSITTDGKITDGTNTYDINMSGQTPTGGYLTYENNILKNGCITIDEYKTIIVDGEVATVEKGDCKFRGEVITDIPENGHTGVKAIIYLDPTDITTECNAELALVNVNNNGSPTGIKSGCMKWYAFEEEDSTYTMILDHNTTATVPWIIQEDYEQTGSQTVTPSDVGIEYNGEKATLNENGLPIGIWDSSYGTNNRGPITLLNQLKADTSNWVVAEYLTKNDSYTAEWTSSNSYYTGNQKYIVNYNGYKARLMSGEEINELTGGGPITSLPLPMRQFDNNCSYSYSCSAGTNAYAWLFDYILGCTDFGCNAENDFDMNGYWTTTPSTHYATAYRIGASGNFGNVDVNIETDFGVRPVIKVSKFILSK